MGAAVFGQDRAESRFHQLQHAVFRSLLSRRTDGFCKNETVFAIKLVAPRNRALPAGKKELFLSLTAPSQPCVKRPHEIENNAQKPQLKCQGLIIC
jgi:hypothetical protein